MKDHRVLLCIAASVCLVSLLASPALAKKSTLRKLVEHYKLNDAAAKCTICHQDADDPDEKNLNVFGKDLLKTISQTPRGDDRVAKALDSIADKDSDGDGATNVEEIELGTSPGDPKSTPTAEKLAEYRKTHPKK